MIKVIVTIEDKDGNIYEWTETFHEMADLDAVSLGDILSEAEMVDGIPEDMEEWDATPRGFHIEEVED